MQNWYLSNERTRRNYFNTILTRDIIAIYISVFKNPPGNNVLRDNSTEILKLMNFNKPKVKYPFPNIKKNSAQAYHSQIVENRMIKRNLEGIL